MENLTKDEKKINEIVARFFDLFTNTNNRIPNIRAIYDFFLQKENGFNRQRFGVTMKTNNIYLVTNNNSC